MLEVLHIGLTNDGKICSAWQENLWDLHKQTDYKERRNEFFDEVAEVIKQAATRIFKSEKKQSFVERFVGK